MEEREVEKTRLQALVDQLTNEKKDTAALLEEEKRWDDHGKREGNISHNQGEVGTFKTVISLDEVKLWRNVIIQIDDQGFSAVLCIHQGKSEIK